VRIDYSDLVTALREGDEQTANELLEEVMPRLREYLRVVMKADENVAKECAQQAFTDVFERIRKGKIKEKKYIFSYLLTSTRNEFLRYSKFQHRFDSDSDAAYEQSNPAEQIQALIDKERMMLLEECMYELDRESRTFIRYLIDNPGKSSKEYGMKFEMSDVNVRTKKSRIINQLHLCYKRKSSQ
jgi:RNA polymerase sigma factor (sigma-70 family)